MSYIKNIYFINSRIKRPKCFTCISLYPIAFSSLVFKYRLYHLKILSASSQVIIGLRNAFCNLSKSLNISSSCVSFLSEISSYSKNFPSLSLYVADEVQVSQTVTCNFLVSIPISDQQTSWIYLAMFSLVGFHSTGTN